MDFQAQIDAMAREYAAQRDILGNRAVQLAAHNAQLMADKADLEKRLAEFEKKPEET